MFYQLIYWFVRRNLLEYVFSFGTDEIGKDFARACQRTRMKDK